MQDQYPTRQSERGSFLKRQEPVAYNRPLFFSHDQWLFYQQNGFIVMNDFFDKTMISDCFDASGLADGYITKEPGMSAIRAVTGIHEAEPFSEAVANEKLIQIVKSLLGSDVYVHQSRINYKKAVTGSGWSWHSDFETWHSQDGMPAMRCISAMIPLTSNTECNGALMLIPGSHKLFYSAPKGKEYSAEENFADQKEGVPNADAIRHFYKKNGGQISIGIMNPGDLLLFDCNTLHASSPNLSANDRTNLFVVYNSVENKLQTPFSNREHRHESMGTTEIKKVF